MKNNMNLKQKNFYIMKELYQIINSNQESICIFVHFSNLNTVESNQIKIFCESNNVQTKYIKVNLMKRLTKNPLLLNLLTGPTKLFFFSNVNVFLSFFENLPFKNKVIPLAAFFDNNFFSYSFFFNYLKNIKLFGKKFDYNLKQAQSDFTQGSTNNTASTLSNLNNPLLNFIQSLSYLNNNNKNN